MNIRRLIYPPAVASIFHSLARSVLTETASVIADSDKSTFDAIDAYIEQEMLRLNIPGVSLAIVARNDIVHVRGFSTSGPDREAPSARTLFLIGSLTKSITALAVMQLSEAGLAALDAPVQRYLPWFRVADTEASAQITVRHLLNQTSGLPQLPGLVNLANFDDNADAVEQQVRALSTLALTRPVGSEFEYSNLNYNVLGLVIESASGERYTDYIQRHVFDPLEMHHSYTSQAAAQQDDLAQGHTYWFGTPVPVSDLPLPAGSLPSGQLISCAEDIGHYLIAHLSEGRYGDAQVLSGAGIDTLHRPAAEMTAMGHLIGHYAMGWISQDFDGTQIILHSGIVPDYFAFMALIPEQQKGIVLLINADNAMLKLTLEEVGTEAARRLAGLPPAPSRLGAVIWLTRALLLIPLFQIIGLARTMRMLAHWHSQPANRPRGLPSSVLTIVPPLIANFAVALSLAPVMSKLRGFLLHYSPDLSWTAIICGGFAAIWAGLRTLLIVRMLRKPQEESTR